MDLNYYFQYSMFNLIFQTPVIDIDMISLFLKKRNDYLFFLDGQIAKGFGRSIRMNDDARLVRFLDNLNLLSLINGRYIYSPIQMNHPDLVFQDRVDLDNGANQIYYYENT